MLAGAVDEADRHGAFLITVHARGSASVAMAARCGVRIIHHACFLDDEARARARGAPRRHLGVPRAALPVRHGRTVMPSHGGSRPSRSRRPGYPGELARPGRGLHEAPRLRDQDRGRRRLRPPVDPPRHLCGRARSATSSSVDMTPIEAIHTATRNVGRGGRPRRRRDPRGRRWPTCSSSTATRPSTSPCCSSPDAGARRDQGRRRGLRQPSGLPVTDSGARDDPVRGRRLARLLVLRHELDARDGLTHGDDGVGLPRLAARQPST